MMTHEKIKQTLYSENELIKWYQTRPPIWIRMQTADTEKLFKEFSENEIQYIPSKTVKDAVCIKNAKVNLYSLKSFESGFNIFIFEIFFINRCHPKHVSSKLCIDKIPLCSVDYKIREKFLMSWVRFFKYGKKTVRIIFSSHHTSQIRFYGPL